jgi:hypothetical protein
MRQEFEKLFSNLKPAEPPAGLFDRIILAIKREQELQQTRRLLFGFLSLLIISFITMPFSWTLLAEQAENSGIFYFISAAISDFGVFLTLWQSFGLAIIESLPIMAIVIFTLNMALILWTLRLFLYRKRLLLAYLIHR